MSVIKFKPNDDWEKSEWRERYRYSVYEHKLVFDKKSAYTRSFIVVKNQYDVIVHFTCYHNYVDVYANGVCVPLTSDVKAKMHYVCVMLNYSLIEKYDEFGIRHIFNIDKNMLNTFFQDYALTPQTNGSYRSRQSIEKCVSTVTSFIRKLCGAFDDYMKISPKDLYDEKTVFTKRGQLKKKLTPDFKVRTPATGKTIFRDIPTKVFKVIVNQAFCHTPEIVFAICLQAFAGLRPSEVCNVRQKMSPLGRGINIIAVDGAIKSIEIDLTVEYVLRSDGVKCGGIKTERKQRVYPAFIPAFYKAYEFHKSLLRGKFEVDYCPMFVVSNGMALRYFEYRRKFQRLITEWVRPALIGHIDPECRLYGQLLYENSLGPHALRHWFSVQLALMGEDVAGMQYWRGDTSPESALLYLQNKGDLIKELSVANDMLANFLTSEGADLHGK